MKLNWVSTFSGKDQLVLAGHAGQEIEEPENVDILDEIADTGRLGP